MSENLATVLYTALIFGLFWLVRDNRVRTAPGLWLPVIWLFLSGSRSVSEWFRFSPPDPTMEGLVEGDPINRIVYAGLVGLGLMVLAVRWARVLELLKANAAIVFFLLYCVVSLAWADHPDVGIKRWVKAAGDFIMVLIVVSDPNPESAIRRLLVRTGFLLIPLSVLMIKYYPDIARYYDRWEWATYYSGVTTNKNALGVICLLFGLTSAWQILSAISGGDPIGRVRRIIAHSVIFIMVIWLFRLANSMTALAGFFVGIVVLLVVACLPSRPVKSTPVGIVADRFMLDVFVLLLIAVPYAVLIGGVGPGLLKMIGKDPTLTDRTMIWELVLSLTPDALLGTGFENFWLGPRLEKIWSIYSWRPNQAHNGFVEIFLNLGWIGVALVTIVLSIGYRIVLAGVQRSPVTGSLMLAFFVVGIIYNFTEAALFRISAPAWFVLLLAITIAPTLPVVRTKTRPSRDVFQIAIPKPPTVLPALGPRLQQTIRVVERRVNSG